MSIIADTLQRLQTQTKSEASEQASTQSSHPPARGKRESTKPKKNSRSIFWVAGIGMTLGLGGLGAIAFWLGLNLDFGLSTYASHPSSQSLPFPSSSLSQKIATLDSPSSESMQVDISHPVQDTPTASIQKLEEEPHPIQHVASLTTSQLTNTDTPPSTIPVTKSPASSDSLAPSDQPKIPLPTPEASNQADEESPIEEIPEEKTASTNVLEASITEQEDPIPNPQELNDLDLPEAVMPLKVALVEEVVQTEEFSKVKHQSSDQGHTRPAITALKLKREQPLQKVQSSVPLHLTPTHRLQQAQQLIQARRYTDAVPMLSPLFNDPPVSWEPWFWMGSALLGQGQLEQADQFFLSGLARNDKIPQLWIQRALVAQQRGNFQLAIHELRQAESLEADLPHIHLNMGYAYEKLGNDRLANQYYGKFLKLSEGNPVFFPTRKKLFARLTQQIPSAAKPGLPSSLSTK